MEKPSKTIEKPSKIHRKPVKTFDSPHESGPPRPGNPYLVAVMPLLQSIAASGGFLPDLNEKAKHVISQDSWRLVKIEPEVQENASKASENL